jgi:hypothetical protein
MSRHIAAMPYGELPRFMGREGVVARALEFCILTAARTTLAPSICDGRGGARRADGRDNMVHLPT